MPAKSLPSRPSLDHLKYQAKHLVNTYKARDPEALARIREFHPKFAPAQSGSLQTGDIKFSLAEAQLVIAREYGFESWPKLKRHVVSLTPAPASNAIGANAPLSLDALASRFLEYACPDHHVRGGPDHVMARHAAARLLQQHPDLAHYNLATAVVCGNLPEVQRILAEHPRAAVEKTATATPDRTGPGSSEDMFKEIGPKGWEPLLYLCFARLPGVALGDNALAIARTLLDHGADPNAFFMAGSSRYTPLVGVIGEGEEDRPPHPQRDALTRLLLERGAEPYDIQVLYNIHFHGRALWFLKLIYDRSITLGRHADWADPDWSMLGMGGYGSGARYLLNIALEKDDLELAEWCLAHGANPNAAPAASPRLSKRTLHEEALRNGLTEMATLLVRHGAMPGPAAIEGEGAFVAACLRLDRAEAQRLLAEHPEYLHSPAAMFKAAERDRADVAALLLDLGMSPDVADAQKQTALHVAAYSNAARVAALLIEKGAVVDQVEENHGATPIGFAVWGQRQRTIEVLVPVSRDIWSLTFIGNVERLREVLRAEPELARVAGRQATPLMRLPGDQEAAVETVKLLLALGADPSIRNGQGLTAADLAAKRGLDEAAALLRSPADKSKAPPLSARDRVRQFEALANDVFAGYQSGDPEVLRRLSNSFARSLTQEDLRTRVRHRLRSVGTAKPEAEFTLADAQLFVAKVNAFESWAKFIENLEHPPALSPSAHAGWSATPPFYKIDARKNRLELRPPLSDQDWDAIFEKMQALRITGLNAAGQMTDAALERLSQLDLDHLTHLNLGGCNQLTDDGILHLARMPQLQSLDLSGWESQVTDRGLEVLRHLPLLKKFKLCWPRRVTDAGVAHLAGCDHLEIVNVMGTPTGDGVIRALAGKAKLRYFKTGRLVTDDGLPLLHQFPVFKTWQGGEIRYGLMAFEAGPNHLMLDGPFTAKGMAALAGLDGLAGLSFFWHCSAFTADGLDHLAALPHLAFLGCGDANCTDDAMRRIAAIPRLRMLMGQGTVASDAGFAALSRSQSIEYIWGRECPNLAGPGFQALANMPALRGLAVSCKNVDDASLSALSRFPALTELMPMDISDAGFRHVGRCTQLENLVCMYCRETTDAATEQLTGLSRLKYYYAGGSRITDRSLEILSRLLTLERVELHDCAGITNTGLAFLAALPHLREVNLDYLPNVTREGVIVFRPTTRVNLSV